MLNIELKRRVLAIFLPLWISSYLISQTTIPGGQVSGLWTKANSPYLITAAIMVANGTSLTIEPGVKVQFQGSYKLLNLGQITAVGSAVDSIVFTAQTPTVGWLGIRFDQTQATNDSSRFAFCVFEYGNVLSQANPDDIGGAMMFNGFSKVLITNSRFSNCKSTSGGAINSLGSSIKIANSIFSYNTAVSSGAIQCWGNTGQAIIINNRFINNTATGLSYSYGGALGVWNNCVVSGNFFKNNSANSTEFAGGALYCGSSSAPTISNNIFEKNTCVGGGGAIYCYGCTPFIYNNHILNNSAGAGGGFFGHGSSEVFYNNILVNNSAQKGGAVYYYYGATPDAYNNTLANNFAQQGGAICFSQCSPTIKNSIMYGNRTNTIVNGYQIFLEDEGSDPNFNFCDIEGGQAAFGMNSNIFYLGTYTNNINADPKFLSPTVGSGSLISASNSSWYITNTSPCIDKGDPVGVYPALDFANHQRVENGIIDIGPYEYSIINFINEAKENRDILIYPNPTQGKLSLLSRSESFYIEVMNLNGKKVYINRFMNTLGPIEIDLTEMENGIYFIKCDDGSQISSGKVVLQK